MTVEVFGIQVPGRLTRPSSGVPHVRCCAQRLSGGIQVLFSQDKAQNYQCVMAILAPWRTTRLLLLSMRKKMTLFAKMLLAGG
jgi:hypothetical protein